MADNRLTNNSGVAFILGRSVAARHTGIEERRQNELGLVTAVMGATTQSLILVDFLARRESEDQQRREQTDGGGTGGGADVTPAPVESAQPSSNKATK